MLEGKRISELDTVTNLQQGCCFPVLSSGATKRITFGSLLSEIENNLPETGIEQVKEDVAELKVKTEKIDELSADVENVKEQVADVDEMVQGQNATIRNYGEKVDTLEQIVEDTHFEDVLELEGQVRTNTTNITRKLDNTTSPDNAGKVVKVNEDGTLGFGEGGGGGSALVPDITQEEYDELTPEEQNNGQIRHIIDAEETPVPFAVVNDSKMSAANVWTAQKTNSEINTTKTQIMNRTSLDWENAVETVATNLNENTFTATEDGVLFWDLVGCNGNFAYIEINGVMITKSTALDSSYVSSTNGNVIISQGDIIKWKDGYNVNTTTALHKIIFVPYKNN